MPIKIKIRKNRHYFSPLSFPRARKVPTFHFYFSNGRLVAAGAGERCHFPDCIAAAVWLGWTGLGWAGLVLHHPAIISGQNQLQKHKQHITDPPTSPRVWFSNNCYLPADHSPVISVCPMRLDIALFPHWRSSICPQQTRSSDLMNLIT